jgi:hypothetical protein
MTFRDLQLDRKKIESAIENCPYVTSYKINLINGKQANYTFEIPDQEPSLVSIYYKINGTVTINTVFKRNEDMGAKIAEHIIEHCQYQAPAAKQLYKKDVSVGDFQAILDYFGAFSVAISDPKPIAHGTQYTVMAEDGGTIHINRFNNNAISVQGESIFLKLTLIDILSQVLPYKEVIDIQLQTIDVETTVDEILDELSEIIPSAIQFIDPTIKSIIAPSIVLRKMQVNLEDYSFIVYPALRGLEGVIKQMFNMQGVIIGDNFGGKITFDPDSGSSTLDPAYITFFTANMTSAIEKAYSYYKTNRHGIFHVDGTIVTTRIIESKDEGEEILGEVFALIEECTVLYNS